MPRLRDNVLANYAGQAWVAIMGVAFVPVYLRLLGIEQFGLIAFMLSLQTISLLLDMGTGVFLGRELAQRAHHADRRDSIRQLIRSFECLIWPTAALIAILIVSTSGEIASHWLHPEQLGKETTTKAVGIIGLVVALLWPTAFYASALSGLEQQKKLNVLVAVFATLRYAGVVPVLLWSNSGLLGFLWWHCLIAGLQSICSAMVLWRHLPQSAERTRFQLSEILGARHFALGVFSITALGLILSQMDRLAMSALRPLEELGYYGVALTISGGLGRLVQPMFAAIYPRLSKLAGSDDQLRVSELYHLSSQIVAAVVAAVAGVVCIYSESVLRLWTGDSVLSAQVALPLTLVFAGTAINGVMNVPYALQLAHGWTRLAALSNLVGIILFAPAFVLAVENHGMTGAAAVWLAVNVTYLVFIAPLLHRRLLRGELGLWYAQSVLQPFSAAFGVVLVAKWLYPSIDRTIGGVTWISATGLIALTASLLVSQGFRKLLIAYLRQMRIERTDSSFKP
ncbi:lipopolysaccharide biosynthesis protein [Dokdonella sp.]|uniref:lipopolysaccharide biosynthesis protein n=1 Tax=Dokdonella sp. TaxID=2291710 RepID=UPI0035274C92